MNFIILAGGYIFNTEAHPIDPGILYCCGIKRHNDTTLLRRFEENIDFLSLLDLHDVYSLDQSLKEEDLDMETIELEAIEKELLTLTNVESNLIVGESLNG